MVMSREEEMIEEEAGYKASVFCGFRVMLWLVLSNPPYMTYAVG